MSNGVYDEIRTRMFLGHDQAALPIHTRTPCPLWDSNPHFADFKSTASASWAKGAK